jgi:hypothetical protein
MKESYGEGVASHPGCANWPREPWKINSGNQLGRLGAGATPGSSDRVSLVYALIKPAGYSPASLLVAYQRHPGAIRAGPT